jgi:Kef-type K+ transport system membrane component KefB
MKVFLNLDETSSQVRVRLAVMLLLASVVIANRFGFESILGAFLMGAVLAIVVRTWEHEERFRSKIEAVGFGFFVPVFFVTSGLNVDLSGLSDPAELMRIPLFIAILLAVHMLPATLYRNDLSPRETAAAGLLQATNLSFIVVVANLGTELGEMRQVTGDALIMAGLFSALVFPAAAQKLLGGAAAPQPQPADAPSDEDL